MNSTELAARYYLTSAAAYIRGRLGSADGLSDVETFNAGEAAGLRLHRFKRSMPLPRVQRVLGLLRSLAPQSLLDLGSGRGAFLWPLLDAFPALALLAIDRDPQRAAQLGAVARGGGYRFAVTLLEVLEHLPCPADAAAEALRVSRGFVIVSVPSRADDNPQHIHRFDRAALEQLLCHAGARRVSFDYVHNHAIALARV